MLCIKKSLYLPTLIGLLLLSSLSANAQLSGAVTEGNFGMDGALKKALFRWTFPIGKLSVNYGYEVLDFKNSEEHKSEKNKALYCQGGMSFSNSSSIFGVSYGGSYSALYTFGRCEVPKDYTGGFLDFSVGYNFPTGRFTSNTAKAGLHLGFDMKHFNESVKRDFHTYNHTEYDHHTKVKWAVSHLLTYSKNYSMNKNIKISYKIISKIFSKIFAIVFNNDSSFKNHNDEFSKSEIDHVIENKEDLGFDPKAYFKELYYSSRKDSLFYTCEDDYPDCEMIWLDTQNLIKALYESFGNCHSVSGGVSLDTSFSLYNFKLGKIKIRVGASAGYSHYVHEKSFRSILPNVALSDRHYWRHIPNDFIGYVGNSLIGIEKKLGIGRECSRAASTASQEFGTFLGTLVNFKK